MDRQMIRNTDFCAQKQEILTVRSDHSLGMVRRDRSVHGSSGPFATPGHRTSTNAYCNVHRHGSPTVRGMGQEQASRASGDARPNRQLTS